MPVVTAIAVQKSTMFWPKNHAFDPKTRFLIMVDSSTKRNALK
jgi:hypothetical protein